jgi:molecular chaperone GrpE
VLKNQNVEEIAPEPGTPFDPNLHEAVMQQPSDKYPEQTVLQLLQKGYSLHGRRLRPASVVVSKPA